MRHLTAIKKGMQRINYYVCFIGMVMLIPMLLLITGDVISRALWNRTIPGTIEISSYLLSVFVLLGIAYTHQLKGHIRVTVFTDHLPKKVELIMNIITTIISLFISFILIWQGWVLGIESKTVSDMLRIPQLPFKLLVSLAGFLLFMELLFDLLESSKKLAMMR